MMLTEMERDSVFREQDAQETGRIETKEFKAALSSLDTFWVCRFKPFVFRCNKWCARYLTMWISKSLANEHTCFA